MVKENLLLSINLKRNHSLRQNWINKNLCRFLDALVELNTLVQSMWFELICSFNFFSSSMKLATFEPAYDDFGKPNIDLIQIHTKTDIQSQIKISFKIQTKIQISFQIQIQIWIRIQIPIQNQIQIWSRFPNHVFIISIKSPKKNCKYETFKTNLR